MVSRNGVLCPRPRRKPVAAARSDPLASPSLSLRGHTPLQPRRLLSSLVFVVLCARGSFSTSAPATADARSAPLRGLFPRCIVPLHAAPARQSAAPHERRVAAAVAARRHGHGRHLRPACRAVQHAALLRCPTTRLIHPADSPIANKGCE